MFLSTLIITYLVINMSCDKEVQKIQSQIVRCFNVKFENQLLMSPDGS